MRLLLACLAVTGCIDDRTIYLPDVEQAKVEWFELPQSSPPPVDVIIAIDNSAGMEPYATSIPLALEALGDALDGQLAWWDHHIGIVTSDVGCPGGGSWRYDEQLTNDRFLIEWRHLDDTVTRNFDGTIAEHLARLGAAGHAGCGEHRPLDAIAAVLDPALGFRRQDADLVIIVVSASDDRSTISPGELVAAIEDTGARTHRIPMLTDFRQRPQPALAAIHVIAPPGARRLASLDRAFDDELGSSAPITSDVSGKRDGADAMMAPINWWRLGGGWWGGARCFESAIDLEPAAGVQARCAVSDVTRTRRGDVVLETMLPACDGNNRPCWRLVEDPQLCPGERGLTMEIDRIDFPPPNTFLVGQCEVATL